MDSAILVQNIKSYCKTKGVPPTVACKEAKVGGSFINDIERGQVPSVGRVQQLADYLGCTVSDLLGEKKEPTTVTGDGQGTGDAEFDAILKQLDRDDLELLKVQAALMAKRKQKK